MNAVDQADEIIEATVTDLAEVEYLGRKIVVQHRSLSRSRFSSQKPRKVLKPDEIGVAR